MPMLPIDLQTMFSNINHVGKDQSAQKEGVTQQQSVSAMELVAKSREIDETVVQTEDTGDGAQKLSDKEQANKRNKQEERKKHAKDAEDKKKVVYQDPDLGRNIDITG